MNDYIRLEPAAPEGYFFAGRTCLALEAGHKAVWYLEQARDREKKTSPLLLGLLGAAYLKARRSETAVVTLQKAVEAAPEDGRIFHAYLNALFIRGLRLCRNEDYELGSQMLKFVLKNGGKAGPLICLELGRAYRELGRLDDAEEMYLKALEFAPSDPMIHWYRSSILMEQKRDGEALKEIEAVKALGAKLPELSWNGETVDRFMILALLKAGEWRRAADACRDWIKKRGASPAAHAMYAEAQRNLKLYKPAENHLKRAIELDGKSLDLRYSLILCAWEGRDFPLLKKTLNETQKMGGDPKILSRFYALHAAETGKDPKKTIPLLQEAIRNFGPESDLMYALGKNCLDVGLLEEAIRWFLKVIEIEGDHEESWLGIIAAREVLFTESLKPPEGITRRGGEEAEEEASARDALEKAYAGYLERWGDNRALRRDEALFLVRIQKYSEAVKKLEELLAWDPANPALRRVLAYSYRRTGRYREAALYLRALLKENPRELRLLLEYSGCVSRTGKNGVRQAGLILEKALPFFTTSSEIPLALGLLAYREGRTEKAFELLLEAASRNKNDPQPWRWMALIAKKKGDRDGAERYGRRYRQTLEKTKKGRPPTPGRAGPMAHC